eukprot:TRINITY_DN66_c0_g1_i11.p1 TRINITY_DN66_c0_g1~~TRINITY_DN66_c0_g1_i11.p1  ORF type:complete len:128 (+),score=51.46 TRINITY_DN66_c0_g1_i11:68-451(+)
MSIRMLLVVCLAAVALADTFQIQQCTNKKATGKKMNIKTTGCNALTFGKAKFNLALSGVKGRTSNSTLVAVVKDYPSNKCTGTVKSTGAVACTCVGSNAFSFVCNGSPAIAIPSLFLLAASLVVYLL